MELHFFTFQFISTLLIFLFMLLKLSRRLNRTDLALNLPPGPWKLPLIGNMHQLAGALPHHILRDLAKKHGPIISLKLGEVLAVVVTSPDTAKEVMKTHDIIFASRPYLLASQVMSYDSTNIAFSPYGEYWRQLRKIATMELLSPKRVSSFQSIREGHVSKLIRKIASNTGSAINLTREVFSLIYGITSTAAFGEKSREQDELVSIVEESIVLSAGFNVADFYPSVKWLEFISGMKPKFEKLHREADRIMTVIIKEHQVRKAMKTEEEDRSNEDLIDALLEHHENEKNDFSLTIDNIKAVLMDIFGAGSETSATTIDWAMAEMMRDPSILQKAQAEVRRVFNSKRRVDEADLHELKYVKLVIKEVLRLHPPAPLLLPRECGENCQINGYDIPVKTKVIVNAWAIGRDPKYWTDSETFKPERFLESSVDFKGNDFEYIPFGSGRRVCPGIGYALVNIEVPLANLLYHFDWEVPSGMKQKELDMAESSGVTVRRKEDLKLIPTPYNPVSIQP